MKTSGSGSSSSPEGNSNQDAKRRSDQPNSPVRNVRPRLDSQGAQASTEQYAELAQQAVKLYQAERIQQLVARAPVQGLQELQVPSPNDLSSFGNSYYYKSLAAPSNAIDNISSEDALTPKDIILKARKYPDGYTQFLSNFQEEYQRLNLTGKERLTKYILGYLINNGFTFRSKRNAYTAEEQFQIINQKNALGSIKYFFEEGFKTGLKNRY